MYHGGVVARKSSGCLQLICVFSCYLLFSFSCFVSGCCVYFLQILTLICQRTLQKICNKHYAKHFECV